MDEAEGFQCLGQSNWTICNMYFQPLLFWKFSNLFIFILGGQFLLPQSANNGKREFYQTQKWMRQRVSSALGIQTGPYASHYTPFVLAIFQLFHSHTGRPILIAPESQYWEKGNFSTQNWMRQRVSSACLIQTGPLAAH